MPIKATPKELKKLPLKKNDSLIESSPISLNYAQDARSNAAMSIGPQKSKLSKADLIEKEIQMQVLLRKQQ